MVCSGRREKNCNSVPGLLWVKDALVEICIQMTQVESAVIPTLFLNFYLPYLCCLHFAPKRNNEHFGEKFQMGRFPV